LPAAPPQLIRPVLTIIAKRREPRPTGCSEFVTFLGIIVLGVIASYKLGETMRREQPHPQTEMRRTEFQTHFLVYLIFHQYSEPTNPSARDAGN
jgi:hypothetical protein